MHLSSSWPLLVERPSVAGSFIALSCRGGRIAISIVPWPWPGLRPSRSSDPSTVAGLSRIDLAGLYALHLVRYAFGKTKGGTTCVRARRDLALRCSPLSSPPE